MPSKIKGTMPEGFAELLQFLEERPGEAYKTAEIQVALQMKHQFTSGKVTGIIKRACEHGMIENIGRSYYKLRTSAPIVPSDAIALCKKEIQTCITKIETISGQSMYKMSQEEFDVIKQILAQLKALAE